MSDNDELAEVTVIIPCVQLRRTSPEARWTSCSRQTSGAIDLVVIDDQSTDDLRSQQSGWARRHVSASTIWSLCLPTSAIPNGASA